MLRLTVHLQVAAATVFISSSLAFGSVAEVYAHRTNPDLKAYTTLVYDGEGWGPLRRFTFKMGMGGNDYLPETYIYDCTPGPEGYHYAYKEAKDFKKSTNVTYEGLRAGDFTEVSEKDLFNPLLLAMGVGGEDEFNGALKRMCAEPPRISLQGIKIPNGSTAARVGDYGEYTFIRTERFRTTEDRKVQFWAERARSLRVRENIKFDNNPNVTTSEIILVEKIGHTTQTQYLADCRSKSLATLRIVSQEGDVVEDVKGDRELKETIPGSVGEGLVETVCALAPNPALSAKHKAPTAQSGRIHSKSKKSGKDAAKAV
jgi:hypothetical protein